MRCSSHGRSSCTKVIHLNEWDETSDRFERVGRDERSEGSSRCDPPLLRQTILCGVSSAGRRRQSGRVRKCSEYCWAEAIGRRYTQEGTDGQKVEVGAQGVRMRLKGKVKCQPLLGRTSPRSAPVSKYSRWPGLAHKPGRWVSQRYGCASRLRSDCWA
jgi:hypothetical protein